MNRSIQSLVRRYQDRQLNSEEISQLEELLLADAEAREIFRHETNLIAAVEDIACDHAPQLDQPVHAISTGPPDTSGPSSSRWTMAAISSAAVAAVLLLVVTFRSSPDTGQTNIIATIVGVNGPLQWTGDGGKVRSDLSVGMKLTGGTIDGISPESWFALQFIDGSKIVTSGTSMLAFSDLGQKVLHLKSGRMSANVTPQPDGAPMLIHTRSAILEIVGTSFDIDTDLASTALNVSEGKVRVTRRSDGKLVEVPEQHHVIAAADQDLSIVQIPKVSRYWRSRLEDGPRRTYGRWLPGTSNQKPMLHSIPYQTEEDKTIYTVSFSTTVPDAAPVMAGKRSIIKVKGRLDRPADLYVGMTMKTA